MRKEEGLALLSSFLPSRPAPSRFSTLPLPFSKRKKEDPSLTVAAPPAILLSLTLYSPAFPLRRPS